MSKSAILACSALVLVPACFPQPPRVDVGARLLVLASREAALVPLPAERMSRLLNVAHEQIGRSRPRDALATLGQARSTLLESPRLDEHARLAAWVSLSDLSRRAGDLVSARESAHEALRFLRALEPVHRRSEYVRDLAAELRVLEGEGAAAAILRESAAWAASIPDRAVRRQALSAIAWDLFTCDDFVGGRDVLRREADPAWRSDTLTTLATHGQYALAVASSQSRSARSAKASVHWPASASPAPARYGKPLNFESVFLDVKRRR